MLLWDDTCIWEVAFHGFLRGFALVVDSSCGLAAMGLLGAGDGRRDLWADTQDPVSFRDQSWCTCGTPVAVVEVTQ